MFPIAYNLLHTEPAEAALALWHVSVNIIQQDVNRCWENSPVYFNPNALRTLFFIFAWWLQMILRLNRANFCIQQTNFWTIHTAFVVGKYLSLLSRQDENEYIRQDIRQTSYTGHFPLATLTALRSLWLTQLWNAEQMQISNLTENELIKMSTQLTAVRGC